MRKILILAFFLWPAVMAAQTPFGDLSSTSESNNCDQVIVVQGDTTVRMTLQTLLELAFPDQTTHVGDILYSDGTDPYWDDPPAGGSSVGDSVTTLWEEVFDNSVPIDTAVWMLRDTITFPFGLGAGNANDVNTFLDGAFMGGWYNEQDSLMSCKVIGNSKGTGADVDVKIVYDATKWDATPTVVWSGTITTAGGQVTSTTFTNKMIPPNVHVWAEVDGTPTEAATLLTLDYLFSKKRAQ
jgi:hypothetical protein